MDETSGDDDAPADWLFEGTIEEAAQAFAPPSVRVAAATRLAYAERLEAAAQQRMSSGDDASSRRGNCQLYFDAYAAACWTNAHAEFLASLDLGIAEPSSPSISSAPCASSGYDLSDLFARRVACKAQAYPKEADTLVALISRCTNPGARGWDSVLKDALSHTGVRTIVVHATVVCLTGMHPQLDPRLRPDWKTRMSVLRLVSASLVSSNDAELHGAGAPFIKEVMRRCLASTMSATPAMHAALSGLGHPVRHLHQPPMQLPHVGMEGAMAAFVDAGKAMAAGGSSRTLVAHIKAAFERRRVDREYMGAPSNELTYDSSWLGKGTADVHARQSLVELASDVWSASFKAHFVAFWIFGQSHQQRVQRLDNVQHAAIHGMNAATRLAASVSPEVALRIQRLALSNPSSGILTIAEAAAQLNLPIPATVSPNGGARSAIDGAKLLGEAGADAAAKLLVYARAAWINEEIYCIDLGAESARMQARALLRRMKRGDLLEDGSDPLEAVKQLPMHATHLCACTECKRVANAHSSVDLQKPSMCQAFNEIGVSSCQIASGCTPGNVQLHCAKRSSAALRTAIQLEGDMKKRKIEGESIDRNSITRLTAIRSASAVESGIAARVRRDAKNAMEQRPVAVACGEHAMVSVPIVGRVVRMYKGFYALCSYCAALTRVQPHLNRHGAEICCLRCDNVMIGVSATGNLDSPGHRRLCRYCGAIDLGTSWKEVKAPLDVAGPNALIPPPLRKVYYCRQHYRGWVPSAHRVLETRVILAHLAHNAKPVFGAEAAAKPSAPRAQAPKKRPGRKLPKAKR